MEYWQLTQMQNMDLDIKIAKTKLRIKEWYEKWDGQVYISFSGGKDSTVLMYIAKEMYPDIPVVFIDTGLEYPEVREFVNTFEDVTILRPKMTFPQVVEKYGYPVISKEQSQYIYQYKTAKSQKTKDTRWNGNKYGRGKISEKWKFLVDIDIPISDMCCMIMKKLPAKAYEKLTGRHPLLGIMASESSKRVQDYLKFGCNAFEAKRPISRPMGFWTDQDVLKYLYNLNYLNVTNQLLWAKVYGNIILEGATYYTTGVNRTGCYLCLYGIHMEAEPNRMQRLKKTHPKLYKFGVKKLKIGEICEHIKVPYTWGRRKLKLDFMEVNNEYQIQETKNTSNSHLLPH